MYGTRCPGEAAQLLLIKDVGEVLAKPNAAVRILIRNYYVWA